MKTFAIIWLEKEYFILGTYENLKAGEKTNLINGWKRIFRHRYSDFNIFLANESDLQTLKTSICKEIKQMDLK